MSIKNWVEAMVLRQSQHVSKKGMQSPKPPFQCDWMHEIYGVPLNVLMQFWKINIFDKTEVQSIYQIPQFSEKMAELLPKLINGHFSRSEFK